MQIKLTEEIIDNIRGYAKDNGLKCENEEDIINLLEIMTGFAWNYS